MLISDFHPPDQADEKALICACSENRVRDVEKLLQTPFDPNKQLTELIQASVLLHLAACHGHLEVVRLLVEAKSDTEARNPAGFTPLHFAATKGHSGVVHLLLEAGADQDAVNKDGWSPLHAAAECGHRKVVRLLVDAGANKEPLAVKNLLVGTGGKPNWSPLQVAVEELHLTVVWVLMISGAKKDAWSVGTLFMAAYCNISGIVCAIWCMDTFCCILCIFCILCNVIRI